MRFSPSTTRSSHAASTLDITSPVNAASLASAALHVEARIDSSLAVEDVTDAVLDDAERVLALARRRCEEAGFVLRAATSSALLCLGGAAAVALAGHEDVARRRAVALALELHQVLAARPSPSRHVTVVVTAHAASAHSGDLERTFAWRPMAGLSGVFATEAAIVGIPVARTPVATAPGRLHRLLAA